MQKPDILHKRDFVFKLPEDKYIQNKSSYMYLSSLYDLLVILLTKASRHSLWTVEYKFGHKFFRDIVPLILASCIFNRKLRLIFNNASDYMRLDQRSIFSDWLLKKCDIIIVRSAAIKRTLERREINAKTIPFVEQSVDVLSNSSDQLQPHILVAGELEQITDINSVLNAFQLVKQKYPRTELTICGYGSKFDSWSRQLETMNLAGLNYVSYSKENLEKSIKDADLFINSFYVEYQSEFLLSAFRLGLPVISSPMGFFSEIKDRENILLVSFNKSAEMAEKIIELVENKELVGQLKVGSVMLANKISKSD